MISYRQADLAENLRRREESAPLNIGAGASLTVAFDSNSEEGLSIYKDEMRIFGVDPKEIPKVTQKIWEYLKRMYAQDGFIEEQTGLGTRLIRPTVPADRSSGHMEFLKGFMSRDHFRGRTVVRMKLKEFADAYLV